MSSGASIMVQLTDESRIIRNIISNASIVAFTARANLGLAVEVGPLPAVIAVCASLRRLRAFSAWGECCAQWLQVVRPQRVEVRRIRQLYFFCCATRSSGWRCQYRWSSRCLFLGSEIPLSLGLALLLDGPRVSVRDSFASRSSPPIPSATFLSRSSSCCCSPRARAWSTARSAGVLPFVGSEINWRGRPLRHARRRPGGPVALAGAGDRLPAGRPPGGGPRPCTRRPAWTGPAPGAVPERDAPRHPPGAGLPGAGGDDLCRCRCSSCLTSSSRERPEVRGDDGRRLPFLPTASRPATSVTPPLSGGCCS